MKRVGVRKFLEDWMGSGNDLRSRDRLAEAVADEFGYFVQCDDLNNGPAEINMNVTVVDIWENEGDRKYYRYTLVPADDAVLIQDRPVEPVYADD